MPLASGVVSGRTTAPSGSRSGGTTSHHQQRGSSGAAKVIPTVTLGGHNRTNGTGVGGSSNATVSSGYSSRNANSNPSSNANYGGMHPNSTNLSGRPNNSGGSDFGGGGRGESQYSDGTTPNSHGTMPSSRGATRGSMRPDNGDSAKGKNIHGGDQYEGHHTRVQSGAIGRDQEEEASLGFTRPGMGHMTKDDRSLGGGENEGTRAGAVAAPPILSLEDQLISALKHKVSVLQSQNRVYEVKVKELDAKLKERQNENPAWKPEHTDKIVRDLHASEKRVLELTSENAALSEERIAQKKEIERAHEAATAEASATKTKIEWLTRNSKQLETDLAELQAAKEIQVATVKRQSTEVTVLQTRTLLQESEAKSLSDRFAQLTSEHEELLQLGAAKEERHQLDMAQKEDQIRDLASELNQAKIQLKEKENSLEIMDSLRKALVMPVGDSMIGRQLDDLRKEHSSVLVALQQRVNDAAQLEDKYQRSEAQVKSLVGELHSLRQEMATKVELVGLLQQKNRILETDSMEMKQMGRQIESMRAQMVQAQKEKAVLSTQVDELAARLYSHYEQVPVEALDAWLQPVKREKQELTALLEGVTEELKVARRELRETQLDVAHLDTKLTISSENEQKLQKKVVAQTMHLDRLTSVGIHSAGGSNSDFATQLGIVRGVFDARKDEAGDAEERKSERVGGGGGDTNSANGRSNRGGDGELDPLRASLNSRLTQSPAAARSGGARSGCSGADEVRGYADSNAVARETAKSTAVAVTTAAAAAADRRLSEGKHERTGGRGGGPDGQFQPQNAGVSLKNTSSNHDDSRYYDQKDPRDQGRGDQRGESADRSDPHHYQQPGMLSPSRSETFSRNSRGMGGNREVVMSNSDGPGCFSTSQDGLHRGENGSRYGDAGGNTHANVSGNRNAHDNADANHTNRQPKDVFSSINSSKGQSFHFSDDGGTFGGPEGSSGGGNPYFRCQAEDAGGAEDPR